MDHFVRTGKCSSVHEVSLAELMDMVRLTDGLPAKRALIGIQPQHVDWGDAPSELVERSIPQARELAESLIARWGTA